MKQAVAGTGASGCLFYLNSLLIFGEFGSSSTFASLAPVRGELLKKSSEMAGHCSEKDRASKHLCWE